MNNDTTKREREEHVARVNEAENRLYELQESLRTGAVTFEVLTNLDNALQRAIELYTTSTNGETRDNSNSS